VTPELWNQAHLAQKENRLRAEKFTKHIHALKGILKCACGCNMQIVHSGGTMHYACVARAHKKEVRNVEPDTRFFGINVDDLNRIIWEEVKYRTLRTEYKSKSNEKIDTLKAEIFKYDESIKEIEREIEVKNVLLERTLDKFTLAETELGAKALERKAKEIDDEIKSLKKTIKSIEAEKAKNARRIDEEIKSQSVKELKNMTLEGKAEIYKNMLEKVVWVSEKKRRCFLIVTYKNGAEVVWLYKNVKGTRVAINLPSSFIYNPETFKVAVTLTKRNPDIKFDFGEQVVVEYTPDEMLESFDFRGNEEWDASDRVWED
jgi:hypothetical protein